MIEKSEVHNCIGTKCAKVKMTFGECQKVEKSESLNGIRPKCPLVKITYDRKVLKSK